MAIRLKWEVDGKGEEAWGATYTTYEGEVPVKASYVAKVKRMTVGKIAKEGDNKGKPRISVLLELIAGQGANGLEDPKWKYQGAPVWDGLNIIDGQAGRTNGFLHALTDGSDAAKRAVEVAFWPPNGPKAEKVDRRDGGSDVHITDIGKYHIGSPDGNCLVRVITKMGKDLEGNPRAEVAQYLPYLGPKPEGASNSNGSSAEDAEVGDIIDGEDDIMTAEDYLADSGDIIDAEVVDGKPPF